MSRSNEPAGAPARVTAECLGAAFLLAGVVGSGIMADQLTSDTAVALLANALATGALLVVLVATLGPISGAHLNPAVTLAMAARGEIGRWNASLYALAQLAGAVAGVWLAHAMFDLPLGQLSASARAGPGQWLSEGVATFGLVFFIFLALRSRPESVPWVVGLYITSAYWFTASTSFANPAVTVARTLTDTFA
ncbi:MAG: aquaporin, partial [Caulobacterales bacterium]|nr:aquaporin [Caulobacterales bacterium]